MGQWVRPENMIARWLRRFCGVQAPLFSLPPMRVGRSNIIIPLPSYDTEIPRDTREDGYVPKEVPVNEC